LCLKLILFYLYIFWWFHNKNICIINLFVKNQYIFPVSSLFTSIFINLTCFFHQIYIFPTLYFSTVSGWRNSGHWIPVRVWGSIFPPKPARQVRLVAVATSFLHNSRSHVSGSSKLLVLVLGSPVEPFFSVHLQRSSTLDWKFLKFRLFHNVLVAFCNPNFYVRVLGQHDPHAVFARPWNILVLWVDERAVFQLWPPCGAPRFSVCAERELAEGLQWVFKGFRQIVQFWF